MFCQGFGGLSNLTFWLLSRMISFWSSSFSLCLSSLLFLFPKLKCELTLLLLLLFCLPKFKFIFVFGFSLFLFSSFFAASSLAFSFSFSPFVFFYFFILFFWHVCIIPLTFLKKNLEKNEMTTDYYKCIQYNILT